MLTKNEKAVMKVIYNCATKNEGKCLLRPIDILKSIDYSVRISDAEIDPILQALATDDNFEMVETEKKGELYYCFILHQNGYAFFRQIEAEKRAIRFKIVLTISGVIMSFILTRILAKIMS